MASRWPTMSAARWWGMALCGALLIDDLDPEIAAGEFAKCSVCLERLEQLRCGEVTPS